MPFIVDDGEKCSLTKKLVLTIIYQRLTTFLHVLMQQNKSLVSTTQINTTELGTVFGTVIAGLVAEEHLSFKGSEENGLCNDGCDFLSALCEGYLKELEERLNNR